MMRFPCDYTSQAYAQKGIDCFEGLRSRLSTSAQPVITMIVTIFWSNAIWKYLAVLNCYVKQSDVGEATFSYFLVYLCFSPFKAFCPPSIHLSFDKYTQTTLQDDSGSDNNGLLANGAQIVPHGGKCGNAANLLGTF